tara:strand:+ start:919 stop:1353 length:435 start_codon:yes stop_codon:yes gene_type:complete
MCTNQEMVETMAREGYARDTQCFLRGMRRKVPHARRWVALKESQNAVPRAGGLWFDFYTASTEGCAEGRRFKTHEMGSLAPIVVWIKMKKDKKWRRMGRYIFGRVRGEVHVVKKAWQDAHDGQRTARVPSCSVSECRYTGRYMV